MAVNLLEIVAGALTGEVGDKLGSVTGVGGSAMSGVLKTALPAILGGLLNKGSTTSGAGAILDMLTRGNHDNVLGNLAGALSGGGSDNPLLKAGAAALPAIFGDRLGPVTDLITSRGGTSRSATSSLLSALAPIALGFITKQLRGSGGLSLAGLTGMLASQRDVLQRAAPPELAGALGVGSIADIGKGLASVAAPVVEAPRDAGSGLWKWLLPIVALGLAFLLMRSCQDKPAPMAAEPVAVEPAAPAVAEPAAAPVVAEPAPAADGLIERTLPDGKTIRVRADGVEDRLIGFLQDGTRQVDKTTWFTFDRLEFETGSAILKASSAAQVEAIAAILGAWPAAKLKLGGYTDNTGKPAANLKLSQQRADAALAAIVARGVAADRLAAEGYGNQFPVADNATEDGRQKNRRIDVRVSAK